MTERVRGGRARGRTGIIYRLMIAVLGLGVLLGTSSGAQRSTIITNLWRSPSGHFLAFERTEGEKPRTICVIRLHDGRLVKTVSSASPASMIGWSGDAAIFALVRDSVWRYSISNAERSRVKLAFPERSGDHLYVGSATYNARLGGFIVRVDGRLSGPAVYAVPLAKGKATLIARGRLRFVAAALLESPWRELILAAETPSPFEEALRPTRPEALRLFDYPRTMPEARIAVAGAPGNWMVGGVISADGNSAVACYQDYPWEAQRFHLYYIDLRTKTIKRDLPLRERMIARRMRGSDSFLAVGRTILATFSLRDFTLHPLDGGPLGAPTAVEPLSATEAAIASGERVYVVDTRSGARRVLWRAARGRR